MKKVDKMTDKELKEALVNALDDIQEVIGLEPHIKTNGKNTKQLKAYLEKLCTEKDENGDLFIQDDDEFSEETEDLCIQLGFFEEDGDQAVEEVEEEQPAEEEVAAENGENFDIVAEVEEAESLRDLKNIAKSYDEFKPIRNKLGSYSSKQFLKSYMLKIAKGEAKLPEQEKEEPKKKAEKKPETKAKSKAKKETKKRDTTNTAMYLVRKTVCEQPEIKVDELMEILADAGFTDVAKGSVYIRRNEMLTAMKILDELGKLKK